MTFQEQYDRYKALIEERLAQFFPGEGLSEAMRYSLLARGKRIRPVLCMAFCEAAGGKAEEALDFGCAVEMIHTYSLIHDDLPCMDDDDLRRGKPTCHKVYGETAAVLAGDALQAAAFQTVSGAQGPWPKAVPAAAVSMLAAAAGWQGMCEGQYHDTLHDGESHTEAELTAINDKKTGAMLRAACGLGVLAAAGDGTIDRACVDAAMGYATDLGLAFQIKDDILDVTSTAEALGKPIGSDASNHKTTYVTLLGVAECEKRVADHTRQALEELDQGNWKGDTGFLRWLAKKLVDRVN